MRQNAFSTSANVGVEAVGVKRGGKVMVGVGVEGIGVGLKGNGIVEVGVSGSVGLIVESASTVTLTTA